MIFQDVEHAPEAIKNLASVGADLPLAPSNNPAWLIVEEGFSLFREHEIESLFAISNGYVGSRASLEEGGRFSQPGVFAAGVYVDDHPELGPTLAVLPDWSHLDIHADGERLSTESGRLLEHRRVLDLRQGAFWREWCQEDPSGRITRVRSLRLASLADRHVFFQAVAVTAENYSGRIGLVDGPAIIDLTVGRTRVAMAAGSIAQPALKDESQERPDEESWSGEASLGEALQLDRVVAVYTSRDVAEPAEAARLRLGDVLERGAPALIKRHLDAWKRQWSVADVQITGDDEAQRAVRFAAYHLGAAANPADECVSIAARGLTGEAYRGHVFWDTEIYMLPFYLFTKPAAARALLMYRFHTLDAARKKAKALGYRGALYAWESADTGKETAPRAVLAPDGRVVYVLTGEQEQHISADVAYAVWMYWRVTADENFMAEAGADILIETARFWTSRVTIEADGSAHIRNVIGPDEYHESVDDNAYTNQMARWNLDRAADAVDFLKQKRPAGWERRRLRLRLDENEPAAWRRTAAALTTGFHPETGLFEQFEGYFGLKEIDVASRRRSTTPIDLSLGTAQIRQSKAIKQADVLLLSALLWDEWPPAVHEANFNYYEPRTAHGSSLSPAIHALVAARLGKWESALPYFHQAGEIDLADNMANAAGGVHMAALGGLWQAAIFGMAGVRIREDGLVLDPHLPPSWTQMRFSIQWRGVLAKVTLSLDPLRIEVETKGVGEMTVAVGDGPACRASPGRRYDTDHRGPGWRAWRETIQ
jgi:trehalose/maltose hydrolase-like predicted phosphorylase